MFISFNLINFRRFVPPTKRDKDLSLTPTSSSRPIQAKTGVQKKKFKYSHGYPRSPGQTSRATKALQMVEQQKVSIRKAAELCGISYGFLHRRLSGNTPVKGRKGPNPVFAIEEEIAMANWLTEMARRGMGLTPKEFLTFVQNLLLKEKRKNPFKDGRPGYDWYYAFLARNQDIVQSRREVPLEYSRSKLTREKIDTWYLEYRNFLISLNLLTEPHRIWNADETGFNMGSKAGKVIGPTMSKHSYQVPHVTGGSSKERLTALFCCNADGQMMPPFLVYPSPAPKGLNPLMGAMAGSVIEYTKKGWMDTNTFIKFIDHFDKYAGPERPVVLIVDSVSSHVDLGVFQKSRELGIEIYRLVPNATHLMQPLDRGVFGPMKAKWYQVLRKHYRDNPGSRIGKPNFAEKLTEAYREFYKPATIVNSFRATGIYPVDSTKIGNDELKPGLTYCQTSAATVENADMTQDNEKDMHTQHQNVDTPAQNARGALDALESVLSTPVKHKYRQRIEEKYDVSGKSPVFDTYKKLVERAGLGVCDQENQEQARSTSDIHVVEEVHVISALNLDVEQARDALHPSPVPNLLAGVDREQVILNVEATSTVKENEDKVSPVIREALVLPACNLKKKQQNKKLLDSLPSNLTSQDCIRKMALNDLKKVRLFAEKEQKAKARFLAKEKKEKEKLLKRTSKQSKATNQKKSKCKAGTSNVAVCNDKEQEARCMVCNISWEDDQENISTWVECEMCKNWIHEECIPLAFDTTALEDENADFICPNCA